VKSVFGCKLLFVVNDSWFFVSHRIPIGIAAKDKYGMEVHLAALTDPSVERVVESGITPHHWNITPRSTNLFREVLAFLSLARIFKSIRPDIVHLVTIKSIIYGGLLARLFRINSVVFAVSGLGHMFSDPAKSKSWMGRITRLTYKFVFAHPNASLIVQNSSDLSYFVDNKFIPTDRVRLIKGSGVDTDKFSSASKLSLHAADRLDSPTILLASRMLWDKGIQTFVDTAAIVKKQIPSAKFVLVGSSDPDNPRSVKPSQLNTWSEQGLIEWWGHKEDMVSIFHGTDIFLFPTVYGEGVPKVLIEACAAGIPIIASDWPGCREIIRNNETGILVEPGSADAASKAVFELVSNPRLAQSLGISAKAMAANELDVSAVVETTCDIYRELHGI